MKSFILLALIVACVGCSSTPSVHTQNYAKLSDHRTFEYEFSKTWKAIEETLRTYKITNRDPSEVSILEMKKLTRRSLQTDWIYAQSRDKYIEFKVNNFPKKQYLQTRVKYAVVANSILGGTEVQVKTEEEIERLNKEGTSEGYEEVEEVDSSRPHEILEKISQSLLSAAP